MEIVNLLPKIFFCSILVENITSVPGIRELKFIKVWEHSWTFICKLSYLFKDDIPLGYSKENSLSAETVVISILSVSIWLSTGTEMFTFGLELVGNIKCVTKTLDDGKVSYNDKLSYWYVWKYVGHIWITMINVQCILRMSVI